MTLLGDFAVGNVVGDGGGIVGSRGYDIVGCIAVNVIGDDRGGVVGDGDTVVGGGVVQFGFGGIVGGEW